jgi:hypothetical protein
MSHGSVSSIFALCYYDILSAAQLINGNLNGEATGKFILKQKKEDMFNSTW